MRSRACLLAVSAAALVVGCGGGEEQRPEGPVKTFAAGQPVEVVGKEYFFTPARVRASGDSIRLELDNEGTLAHNLKVMQGARELGGTPTFPPKGTRGGTVKLAPGRYRMVCTVANHEQLGMVGELEVTRP
jgi:plastocyanin